MIKKLLGTVALTACLAPVFHVDAQQLGIAFRAGTLGLGGEAAVGLTERVVVRGGLGVIPIEPSLTVSGVDVSLELPKRYNVGVDLYLTGAMRIGGGLLFKSDDPRLTGVFTTDQDIGGQMFTPQEIGTLVAVAASKDKVPYALIGFGKHTASGIGLFVDFGLAFLGAPDFQLNTVGGTLSDTTGTLRTALDNEATQFEQDWGKYFQYWPIFNLGLRIGL